MPGDGGGGISLPSNPVDIINPMGSNPLLGKAGSTLFGGAVKGTPLDPKTWGPLANTPFDPTTWASPFEGIAGKKEKEKVNYGTDLATPTLSNYTGLGSLGDAGKLNASTIQNSPWMQMAMEKQGADQSKLLDQSVQNQASALAEGRSNLAMRGGLSTGASERLAMAGANNSANATQNILNQGMSERAGLGAQNAQMQTGIDQFNAQQTQGANQYNIGQSINDLANQNEQNRFKYGEEMKMKGAAMSGQAIENSGKK
jgi:hypothetical protein